MRFKNMEKMKRSGQYLSFLAIMGLAALVCVASPALAATSVNLGTADSFAVLAGSGITNTGFTTINGDVGTHPTPTINGFPGLVTLNGVNYAAGAVTQGAKDALVIAYINAAGQTGAIPIAGGQLGGQTLTPGVYKDDGAPASLAITGTLTLDALGDTNAVFIFQSASTLDTASGSAVSLINGAQPCNVFWKVGSSATLGTTTNFVGNILALDSITLTTGATISGRALARNGAVTLHANTITASTCNGQSTSVPTLSKSFSSASINTGSVSKLTITLSNPSSSVAVLSAQLTDTLPTGVVIAPTPNAVTTCIDGAFTPSPSSGDTAVTLSAGKIPANSFCTVKVDVTAATADNYVNTLAAGALKTSNGENAASAQARLTVNDHTAPPPVPELPILLLTSAGIVGLLLMWRKRKV